MSPEDWIAVSSAVVSLAAFVATWLMRRRDRRERQDWLARAEEWRRDARRQREWWR